MKKTISKKSSKHSNVRGVQKNGKKVVFILGMHRTGSSLLAELLGAFGFQTPAQTAGPAPDNPRGFFEPTEIVEEHDSWLAKNGLRWDSVSMLKCDENIPSTTNKLKNLLIKNFPGNKPSVLKDPRLSLCLPVWKDVVDDLNLDDHYIITFRNPADVAASLLARNSISEEHACLLWLVYSLSAELNTRGKSRSFINFPSWTRAPNNELRRVQKDLGISFSATSLTKTLKNIYFKKYVHHNVPPKRGRANTVQAVCFDVYATLCKLQNDPHKKIYVKKLDHLRESVQKTVFAYENMLGFSEPQQQLHTDLTERLAGSEEQRLEVQRSLEETNKTNTDLTERLHNLNSVYCDCLLLLRKERLTVFRPAYTNCYKFAGSLLRRIFPTKLVEKIKQNIPSPSGIPNNLFITKESVTKPRESKTEVLGPGDKPDIFVFSIIGWNFRFQRPQHISKNLSELGHRVFYIEMDGPNNETVIDEIAPNLYRVRLSTRKTGHVQAYTGRPTKSQVKKWISVFYQFCNSINATSFKHSVIQHPYWWQFLKHLPPEYCFTFDCMDDISGFSNTDSHLLELEKNMLEGCDKLVVSSQCLKDKYSHYKQPHLIRNAADVEHFDMNKVVKSDCNFNLKTRSNQIDHLIRVGYVGAIADWFDVNLVKEVAALHSNIEFHLCGGVTSEEISVLGGIKNVFLYGEIPYSDAPTFVAKMDVMCIPFKILPIINACDPVKFYEYSAMGKPTVSTKLPELKRAEKLVYFADTAKEFSDKIFEASTVGKNNDLVSRLLDYAADNTWGERALVFASVLDEHPLVSVVILSYGNPELTIGTIFSLLDGGKTYPNLEIIVVDNGSSQNDLCSIKEFTDKHAGIKIIENNENLGFAKGNNLGIRSATGKYIMLLNNDTAVSPGAISAMTRHLKNNQDIGVVGALTNNIGNEARVDVNYADMKQMRNIARSITTGYRDVSTPINVVAYFAAMFRQKDLCGQFGLLSEEYGRGMFEDDDHCETIKQGGYRCVLAEDAFVHHHLSATFSKINSKERDELFEKNKTTFESKWGAWKPHGYRELRPKQSFESI